MATLYNENDLKNITMRCENEGPYNDPDDMINENGKKNYAYVTLVMIGDLYVSAAIVMAHSLRLLNTKADLVVLVTPDVSEDGKRVLGKFFDRVIEIDYVTVPNWRTKKQTHRRYLELVFTKFHLFNLTEYKKVLLIDADALVLKYPDHLFSLKTPAGCLLENKDLFISYDSKGNYILPPDGKIKWYDIYCQCCPHGSTIPKEMTDRIYKDFKNSGIGGGLMLLKPQKGEFESILKDVSQGKMKYLLENKLIWPEQQYLTLRYSGNWNMINPIFFGLQGYPHYSVLYGLQYGGDKPFVLNSKIDINLRLEFPDFVLWHKFYGEIIKKHPELTESISLKETNEMHKFFKVSIKRYQELSPNKEKIIMDDISRKYKVPKTIISKNHLEYYFLDEELTYRPTSYKNPLFNDIKEFDYIAPINKLAEYFGKSSNNYYERLSVKYNMPLFKSSLDNYDSIDQIERDDIMLQYLKCRPNIFIITVWSVGMSKFNELVNYLGTRGNIYYKKIINLSKNAIRNLMYWMYDEFRTSAKLEFIEKKLEYTKTQSYNNNVGFIFFDNINNLKISGQGSSFKSEIRNKILELMNADKNQLRGNDILHINDYFYQSIEYAQIILNSNSLHLLENQDVRKYSNNLMKISSLKIQTFKKWTFTNLNLLEHLRILIMGSIVLYGYGVRKSNDIDGFIIDRGNNINEKELSQLVFDDLNNKKTRLFFTDFGLINSSHWRDTWNQKNINLFKQLDVESHEELTLNPKYHMYFNGLKIYTLDFELTRKIQRHRPEDYADFIMMYFYYRKLLGDYVFLNKDNKLQFNDKFNILVDKKDDYIINFIKNEIDKKYPLDEASNINKNVIGEMFY